MECDRGDEQGAYVVIDQIDLGLPGVWIPVSSEPPAPAFLVRASLSEVAPGELDETNDQTERAHTSGNGMRGPPR